MTYDFINQVLMSTKSFLTFLSSFGVVHLEIKEGGGHKLFRLNHDRLTTWTK